MKSSNDNQSSLILRIIDFFLRVRFSLFFRRRNGKRSRSFFDYRRLSVLKKTLYSDFFRNRLIDDFCKGLDGVIAQYEKVRDGRVGTLSVVDLIQNLQHRKTLLIERKDRHARNLFMQEDILNDICHQVDDINHLLRCYQECTLIDGKSMDSDKYLEKPSARIYSMLGYKELFSYHSRMRRLIANLDEGNTRLLLSYGMLTLVGKKISRSDLTAIAQIWKNFIDDRMQDSLRNEAIIA